MMAAEIHGNPSVDAPAASDSEAALKSSDNFQHAGSNAPSVNGTATSASPDELANKHIADIVDDLVNSAEPSISGGSDTENSRLDALKNKDGDKGHVRTSSTARKPTTFKSVSVNKTFLAAKTSGSPGLLKPGDKASPTMGSASLSSSSSSAPARPRLVAKTGLVKGVSANGRPATAPDPNAVWNKNRPVPVPEPRKLTDEELKKYGIHMATRLQQQDEAKGQANWADIDDDDDDWAPEEIRWTDGTKSTIPHHEEHNQLGPPPPDTQLDTASAQAAQAAQTMQTMQSAVAPSTSLSQPPVSLLGRDGNAVEKPRSPVPVAGSHLARPGGLPSGKGLVLKGATEKPTLVVKPPAPPTPVKSPWASLPPVDKAPPVAMHLPPSGYGSRPTHQPQQYQLHQHQHQQPQPQPQPHRDFYGGGPPQSLTPPLPFKEIAADDFSRGGFRDGQPHTNRELFNSQSGRLEPVVDRRGGPRGDMHYRQPQASLLQRPGQPGGQQPEPSPAFQTHRSSGQDDPYGRRRNSSNVSGGSGSFLQRMGRPNDQHVPPEILSGRQPSLAGRSDSPASPRNYSPSGTRSWQARGSPSATFATPHAAAPTAPNALPDGNQPPAHGEVAGIAPPSAANIEAELELQKKIMRERRELAKKRRLEEEAREEAAKRERIRLRLEAMGPAPERKSSKKETAKEEPAATKASPSPTSVLPSASTAGTKKSVASVGDTREGAKETAPDGARPLQVLEREEHGSGQQQQQQQPPQHQEQPSWQGPVPPQPERLASWATANQSTRNVWGAPNSNRSLGNGTFNSEFVRAPDTYGPSASLAKPGPGPIGPPVGQKSSTPPSIAPIAPPKAITSAPPASQTSVAAAAVTAAATDPGDATRSAWASAVKAGDDNLLMQQKAQRAEQQREAEARGMSLQDLRPSIKDTWMPTKLTEEGDRIEERASHSVVHRPATAADGTNTPAPPTYPQQARPSRFFPTRDVRLEETAPNAANATITAATATTRRTTTAENNNNSSNNNRRARPGSPSPPPPDMDGHPAFDGDASHPHVSLPRPQIVVRLPPKGMNAVAEPAPVVPHSHQRTPPSAPQRFQAQPPSASKEDTSWQARFDDLFDRKPVSPPKATTGTSRANDLRVRAAGHGAAAAPPRQRSPVVAAKPVPRVSGFVKPAPQESVNTRSMAEECFERQEMGSLPPVHLPNKAPELAWTPAAASKPLPRRFMLTAPSSRDMEALLKEAFGPSYIVTIRFPFMPGGSKTVNLPTPRSNSNSRRSNYGRTGGGGGGGRHVSGSHRGSNKGRDTASSHSGSHGNGQQGQSSDTNPRPSGGGRSRGGGLRHRSENWTRNPPAPVQS